MGLGRQLLWSVGDGTTVDKSSPFQISTDTNWSAIEAGGSHTIALKKDGTLWAWGNNYHGQLGEGRGIDKYSPVQIGIDSTETLATINTIAGIGPKTYTKSHISKCYCILY